MSVTARVQILLDIDCHSSWGDECTLAQVQKQAIEDAIGHLNHLIQDGQLKAKIIGKPIVKSVIHVQEASS